MRLPRRALAPALAGWAAALRAGPARAANATDMPAAPPREEIPAATPWERLLRRAAGQSVNFHAWAGDARTNAFIAWAAGRMEAQHRIRLRHIRLRDTAEAVARVVAERAAGQASGGAVDLVWINGPNFLAMKQQGLLRAITDALPNFALVDTAGKPATVTDFTVPVEGLAAPWRMAQVVFIHDSARLPDPPRAMLAMPDWARAHPGRLTHPNARDFLGATFLKQALYEMVPDPAALARPATEANFTMLAAPLWEWYRALRPHLWRQGRTFPESGPAQRNLLNDGEIDLMIAFNPAEAPAAIADGLLPETVRSYVLAGGTIGNCSFVGVPFNAAQPEAAMVVANFLLSPEAQAEAADPRRLGSPPVLDLERLGPGDRQRFRDLPRLPGMPSAAELGNPLPEPHPSWMTRLTAEWERRTAGGGP
ncbi:ABC transporter substrate-binding protein [Roseomonas sp. E05]|uniref:ABC transporter substrate-binding protein n=1 Tax=Roseomonas sp. E05 TaxID=3046310 RepID=UPI0024B9C305|nr:ABC transporter substrate-binding protein [Roseomonas sp. E05]MDJ0389913.1 ABC transporter substrate-binding protein [Roseomonas sp. E05]